MAVWQQQQQRSSQAGAAVGAQDEGPADAAAQHLPERTASALMRVACALAEASPAAVTGGVPEVTTNDGIPPCCFHQDIHPCRARTASFFHLAL